MEREVLLSDKFGAWIILVVLVCYAAYIIKKVW